MPHSIRRVRHELKRRTLTVHEVRRLTPHMLRLTFQGPELTDFVSAGTDDHIKLFFPVDGEQAMRDYTPRRFDVASGTLVIDFAVHQAGPATKWALQARPGDTLQIGGPRGSLVVDWTFDWWLLIGDETALPAIGRRIEEAPAQTRVITVAAVPSPEDEQTFETAADHAALWVHRPIERADDPQPLLDALANVDLPRGEGYVWIAAEAKVARAVKAYIRDARGHPKDWMRASGYWARGRSDAHVELED